MSDKKDFIGNGKYEKEPTSPLVGVNADDFSHMTDIELVIMQKECSEHKEDKEFRKAILIELGKRQV